MENWKAFINGRQRRMGEIRSMQIKFAQENKRPLLPRWNNHE